jgi:hypothetical protein
VGGPRSGVGGSGEQGEGRVRELEAEQQECGQVSSDEDARFGCKGKETFWFGYKRHLPVDMSHGLINELMVTPASVRALNRCRRFVRMRGIILKYNML